jgi:SpoVK/Ycf46/Vps4 family AAA+-type ATPase
VLIAVAELCVGYVASDLAALARKSVLIAIKNECRNIDMETFKAAMKDVGASALRDSAINAPPTTRWSDIAGDAGGAKVRMIGFFHESNLQQTIKT